VSNSLWSPETMQKRVEVLRSTMDTKCLSAVLTSDVTDIRYLTGFLCGNGLLLTTLDHVYLWTDLRHYHRMRALPLKVVDVVGQISDSDIVLSPDSLVAALPEIEQTVGVDPGRISQPLWKALTERFGRKVVESPAIVQQQRAIKSQAEIASIRKAVLISEQAFKEALLKLKDGMTEWRLALELEAAAREAGADRLAFPMMIAFGPRSAEPEAFPTDLRIEGRGWLLTDWGSTYNGYVCDIARTVHLGSPTKEERSDYECVREALEVGIQAARPGVKASDIDRAIRLVFAERGRGALFTHHSGHSVGLSPYEPPILHPRSDWVIEEGYVLSIEVGLYRQGMGGIRIEDQILVGKGGIEVFSSGVGTELQTV
jgi:Xaa-Pro aminopeptidase